jgi:RNA polymerase sigma-70 factor (ECF subfamily)
MQEKYKKEFLDAYDLYGESILKHINFRVNNWHLAEDLAQEVFTKTWNYLVRNPDVKIESYKSFLFRIAHNLLANYYRQKHQMPVSIDDIDIERFETPPTQEKEIIDKNDKELIKKYLSELEENYRLVIAYRYIDDLGLEEISKITGKSVNSVSVTIHRALKVLKEKYDRGTRNY